jgi:hypothetical protein
MVLAQWAVTPAALLPVDLDFWQRLPHTIGNAAPDPIPRRFRRRGDPHRGWRNPKSTKSTRGFSLPSPIVPGFHRARKLSRKLNPRRPPHEDRLTRTEVPPISIGIVVRPYLQFRRSGRVGTPKGGAGRRAVTGAPWGRGQAAEPGGRDQADAKGRHREEGRRRAIVRNRRPAAKRKDHSSPTSLPLKNTGPLGSARPGR